MNKEKSDSLPPMPELSKPGEVDVQALVRSYEQRVAQLTTQNVMLEAQVESVISDRQKLLQYVEQLGAGQPQIVPDSVAI